MKTLIAAVALVVVSSGAAAAQTKSAALTDCDRLAASPYDDSRPAGVPGVVPEKIDAKSAIPACEAALKSAPDDVRVMFQLARAYNAGSNYDAAFKQLTAARAKGSVLALVNLGNLYQNGRGVAKDEAEAVRLFRLAADQGNAVGRYNLAASYEVGRGGLPKDDTEALRLYKLAAAQGLSLAQNSVGLFTEAGRGGAAKDDNEAARLYKLAASQGFAPAQYNLGRFSEAGRGGLRKDDDEALRYYKLAADQNHPSSIYAVAVFNEVGRGGLTRNDVEAARLYRLAADKNVALAQNNLARMYEDGRGGLAKDDNEAARLFKLAADQGQAAGQYNLARFAESGRGGLKKDDTEALRLYRLSAAQNYTLAQNAVGFFTEFGRGGLTRDDIEAERLYELAAGKGLPAAQNNLGRFYEAGRGGLVKDDVGALRLYRQAADKGIAGAQNNVGRFYETARGGLDKDEVEAARLYKLAAGQNYAAAQYNLARFAEGGRGGLPRDLNEAARLYKLAADQGNSDAQKALQQLNARQVQAVVTQNSAPVSSTPVRGASTANLPETKPDQLAKAANPAVAPAAPVAPAKPAPALPGERRVALVIGNSAYQAVPTLPNTKNDAQSVADALRSSGFTNVQVVIDAGRSAMIAALNEFQRQADSADWATVFYAGHGVEVDGVNYMIPVDAKLRDDRDVQDEAISINRVLDATANARKLKLVMLDACRENPFLSKMKRSIATRSINRGLAAIEPLGATLVVFAAKDGEVAEDGDGDHSPFTGSLIRRLQQPGVEINRLFRLVTGDVLKATSNRQRPFVYGSLPGEDEYFFRLK